MLKLTYLDSEFCMEWLACSVEEFVASRTILALRSGNPISLEVSSAAFLIPADAPGMTDLRKAIRRERSQKLTLSKLDDKCVEVALQGVWLGSSTNAEEGIFATAMSDSVEQHLLQLWQESQHSPTYSI